MILPPWAKSIRPHQLQAIQSILSAYKSGADLVFLDAPTGSGKTLIGELVRQSLTARGLYLCSSLNLQHQFARDFSDAAILYGRSNYPTYDKSATFPDITSADCTKEKTSIPACYNCDPEFHDETFNHCNWCHPVQSCPYEQAKALAIRSPLCCTNSYYFLYEANYVGSITLGRKLIIIDEADTIEDILLSFVSIQISSHQAKEYSLEPPARKTVESAWVEWARSAESTVAKYIAGRRCNGNSIEAVRRRIRAKRLLSNIKRLNDQDTGLEAGGWVYTGYDKGDIAFKPVQVNHLAGDFLWRHCKKWLLMSATLISYKQMADSLGIENYEVVK